MTREDATAAISALAVGLAPDEAERLLERISVEADAEALRAALILRGAEALLDERSHRMG